MEIVMLGLGHATAPVNVREQTSFAGSALALGLSRLMARPGVYEAVILSTCNRTEIYAAVEDATAGREALAGFLCDEKALDGEALAAYFQFREGTEAVRHLFRVAAGLESQIVGESQILKQVKDAHAAAQLHRTTGSITDTLFRYALMAGKRARTETEISCGAVSTSSAAIELAKETLGSLEGRTALILGSGKMGELAARHLNALGISRLFVANRTTESAERLAEQLGGQAVPFTALHEVLESVDVLFCCTGAPHHVLGHADLAPAVAGRGQAPMLVIDLSVPRNVAPEVAGLSGVRLYDIDGLEGIANRNRAERGEAAREVALIVEDEITGFVAWLKNFQMGSTIASLKSKFNGLRETELERFLSKHGSSFAPAQQALLEQLTQALTNKFLHGPVSQLRDMTAMQQQQHAHTLVELFGLQVEDASERYQRRLRERRGVSA
ncbi:MAG: glutamyl-tRNA reductase [Candidatus Sericytochromatia bacterium]